VPGRHDRTGSHDVLERGSAPSLGGLVSAPATRYPKARDGRPSSFAVTGKAFSPRAMLIDSHCHLDFPDFSGELDAVVGRARAAGIARIVTISTRIKRHAEVLAIAERFPEVYCSAGTHPHHAHEELDIGVDELIARTRHPKVVAIGEAGLDYHYDHSPREAQERGFRNHIAAARATGLPLVIHAREADDDMARILEQETAKGAFPAVLHCFTGGPDLARR